MQGPLPNDLLCFGGGWEGLVLATATQQKKHLLLLLISRYKLCGPQVAWNRSLATEEDRTDQLAPKGPAANSSGICHAPLCLIVLSKYTCRLHSCKQPSGLACSADASNVQSAAALTPDFAASFLAALLKASASPAERLQSWDLQVKSTCWRPVYSASSTC